MPANYAAIESHLRSAPASQQEITFTFDQAEHLMGQTLPAAAFNNFAWWAAQDESVLANNAAWVGVGWRVDAVDFEEQWIRFVRVK